MSPRGRTVTALSILRILSARALSAQGAGNTFARLGHDVLREMAEVNTSDAHGSTTVLANTLAARFVAAGFPAAEVQVVGPAD